MLRYAASRMLRAVVEAVAAKMEAVQADYDQRKADQEQRQAEATAAGAGAAAAAAPGGVDERWRLDKSRAGVKTVVKGGVVSGLAAEAARALAAAGDALEIRLRDLDEGIAALEQRRREREGREQGWEGEQQLQAAHWQRFELLRTWARLGVPPRPPYVT